MYSLLILAILGVSADLVRIPLHKEKQSGEDFLAQLKNLRGGIEASSLPITNYGNSQYYGYLSIGTPPQEFRMQIKTATGSLYVLSSRCYNIMCHLYRTYNSTKSSTYVSNGHFVDENNNQGILSQDTVTWGDMKIPNFVFGEIVGLNETEWRGSLYDGVLGLSWQPSSALNLPTIIQYAFDLNLIEDYSFSLYLTDDGSSGSEITLGGTDSDKYEGEIQYIQVYEQLLWSFVIDEILIGSIPIQYKGTIGIMDSDSPLNVGQTEIVTQMNELLPKVEQDCSNIGSLPNITLRTKEFDLVITPEFWVYRVNGSTCIGVQSYDFDYPLKGSLFLGAQFSQAFYTHYDFGNSRIGFAKSINK